ncbi:MAG: DNA-directed RNA polymerase subunit alpha [Parcubacteria group bacterium RIFOXYD2_FULL_52_8]|nr:MAG: DNA-directed RNA polymerase subunit alpha [Parcubacteria group bacterium RIFOXYD2_FULL_52_8]
MILPSKPKVISEDGLKGVYEIDGLYPGYGHTLGNSLRRIILSSLPGAAITSVRIAGVQHEFSTMEGVKEDIITILLSLKRVRFKMLAEGTQKVFIEVKGVREVTAADIKVPGQVEVCNPEAHIATITDKNVTLSIEMTVEHGLGYVPKELLQREKVEIGTIMLDAIFTPIRRVNYEVENMRVGNRTDYNRLRLAIETDGILTPHEALEKSIEIMINQLSAIIGFQREEPSTSVESDERGIAEGDQIATNATSTEAEEDILKTRVEDVNLSARTLNALSQVSIRTIGGLARKKEEDLLNIPGLGEKGISEIKRALSNYGILLK